MPEQRRNTAGTGDVAVLLPVRRRREVTLWAMLVWAYRDQLAHRYLRTAYSRFVQALAETELHDADMPRPAVHRDAAALHAAVLELGDDAAQRIVHHAYLASAPELPTEAPVPLPTVIDRALGIGPQERLCWAMIDGRRQDYLVRTVDRVSVPAPQSKRAQRAGIPAGIEQVDVEVCPLTWWPDPAFVRAEAEKHAAWVEAMHGLMARIEDVAFTGHAVIGLGIEGAGICEFPDFVEDRPASRNVLIEQPDLVTVDGCGTLYGVRVRARHQNCG